MIELPQNIDLANPEFLQAWNLIRHTHRSVFLTGKAGTGKSTFLRYICEHTKKNFVVLAPTGIAAMNVGGVTLHSFFQIPTRPVPPDDLDYSLPRIRKKLKYSKEKIKLIKAVDLIIIDEISMVRPDVIDFVDRVLRSYSSNKKEPFGGKQLLLVGDIFQLEPVVTSDTRDILSHYYSNFFFFNARVYNEVDLVSIELKKIYRQKDDKFVKILDRIRVNNANIEDLQTINTRYCDHIEKQKDSFTITLATRRDIVDNINAKELAALLGEEVTFHGNIDGDFPDKLLPTDRDLVLKVDAQIIFLKNDKDRRWVNGTIAKVHKITANALMIKLESGDIHALTPEVWRNIKYTYNEEKKSIEEEILGEFTQYPVKAAWALTVHKSQGLTFSNVIIDIGDGAFSSGQTYVALSRCTSLEGIRLKSKLSKRDIIVNPAVASFSRKFNDQLMIENALSYARADILYTEALTRFDNHEFLEAIEKTVEAASLRNELKKKSIQRFIAAKLSVIDRQQREIDRMHKQMQQLAREYIDMGGECLQMPDAWEAALSNFNKALQLDSTNQDALYGKAMALFDGNQFEESLKITDTLRQIDKKNYNAICLAGAIHFIRKTYDKALLCYMTALKIHKKDPDLHDRLADTYDAIGLEDETDEHRLLAAKYRKAKRK